MQAYVINSNVDVAIFLDYYSWLKAHILGDESQDIKGMLRLENEGKPIFSRADVYICELKDNQKFISIHYTAKSLELVNIYLAQYAMIMRSELPERFKGRLGFSRYIRNIDTTKTTILPPENQMHRDILNNHADQLKLLEVFEV